MAQDLVVNGDVHLDPEIPDDESDDDLRLRAPPSLKVVPVPLPSQLDEFVKDRHVAKQLGKALFWDMQTGGDGRVACATCHFHAGTDGRTINTINPGAGGAFNVVGPNGSLRARHFPFHKLEDPEDRESRVLRDSDDVVGGQGVPKKTFVAVVPGDPVDEGEVDPNTPFKVNGVNIRQVTGRNTPSAINSILNHRNFWDGRANFFFNGVSPFGPSDPNAYILVDDGNGLEPLEILLDNASTASQAVGPPNNGVEMSWNGRTFPLLGHKLLQLRPLGQQHVHLEDSLLGALVADDGHGLRVSYAGLIEQSFHERYWKSDEEWDGFSLMESNFSMFWGLAILLYESTLVSDDAPFDRWAEGNNYALNDEQKEGLKIFLNQGECINCHSGPAFTDASTVSLFNQIPLAPEEGDVPVPEAIIERMNMAEGEAVYDSGFYNIGVRPTWEDFGVGGRDPFGNPLSFSRLAQQGVSVGVELDPPVAPDERVAVDGAFKVPSLRNVELTGPYFHNGGQLTLAQVVEFYTRGGDFHEQNIDNLDPDIDEIGHVRGHPERKRALVEFLRSLTDDRVAFQMAPFDHPEIIVPGGSSSDGLADRLTTVPEVGAAGGAKLKPFLFDQILLESNTLAVRRASFYTISRVWTVRGNTALPGPGVDVITVYNGPAFDGEVLGTAPVNAKGGWLLRLDGDVPDPNEFLMVSVKSSDGQVQMGVPIVLLEK